LLAGPLVATACARGARSPTPPAASLPCLPPRSADVRLVAKEGAWPSAACLERADALLARLSPEQKAAQLVQPDLKQLGAPESIGALEFGSVLSGGGSDPAANDRTAWFNLVAAVRAGSLRSSAGIPLLYGIDAVHGHNNVEGAVLFPHAIGLGATGDAALVEQVGRVTAREVAATGIDWTFAPVLAVARDERWGRTYEAFGEEPELVARLGAALIRGLQGEAPGAARPSVLACAKHFVADGGTRGGVDQGDAVLTDEELRRIHLPPYRAAIAAQVGTVMASFSSVNGVPMHCHGPLLTDVLKGELDFRGFVVSDWQGMERISPDREASLVASLTAGVDMFMASRQPAELVATIARLVAAGRIPERRLDEAARRILAVKCAQGLLAPDRFAAAPAAPAELARDFGGAAHREIARRAVRQSVVVLKNEGGLLPLATDLPRVHVVGVIAQDLGSQCGGWTIDWQGRRGRPTPGTTIGEGIREVVGATTQVTFSLDDAGAAGADAIIAVVGEAEPYAEGAGDRPSVELSPDDVARVGRLAARGIPLVVVLVAGRPLVRGDALDHADAVAVAGLPGTEGGGGADVLFGLAPATGRLGHSWPRTSADLPLNVGDPQYDPLFPFGFGLTYPARSAAPPGATSPASTEPAPPASRPPAR